MRVVCLSSLVLVFVLTGCGATPTAQTPETCSIDQPDLVGQIDLRLLSQQLTLGLCPSEGAETLGGAPLLVVADPVDVQTFVPGYLGRALGDVFRAAVFQQCKVPIRQIELGKDFSLTQQGITALTRNLRDVRGTSFQAKEAVITTFSTSRNKAYFVSRRIDLAQSAITAVNSKEVSWQCEQSLFGTTTVKTSIR
jgi:hypothetical protein